MKILFIADIVGQEALEMVLEMLPRLKRYYEIDFTIVNAENADKGKGVTEKQIQMLKRGGVDCLTSGNHIWDPRKKEALVRHPEFLLRPLNYPDGNLGVGSQVFELGNGLKIGVINLQGRSFMFSINCPFTTADKEIRKMRSSTPIIFIDFHAEATAEKQALGWYLDGKVSAVVGTHTHVQTADERILPGGTAYLTDAGMSGPVDSVIGMDIRKAIDRFILQSQVYYSLAKENIRVNGVVTEIDDRSGKAISIKRFNLNKNELNDVSTNN